MTIKDKFKAFSEKHAATLAKVGIKLSGIDEPAAITMVATGELEDGTKVASPADTFSEGSELYVIDAEGKESPAPDGEHKLNDGTIVATADGKIVSITPAEPDEEEMSADEIAANLEELGTKLSSALSENDALKAELEALKADKVNQSTEIEKMKTDIAKLKKQPAAKSVKQGSENFKTEDKKTKSFEDMTPFERVNYNLNKQKSN